MTIVNGCDLSEYVSDWCASIEKPFTAKEIATQYCDQFSAPGTTQEQFDADVKSITPEIEYLLG